MKASIVARRHDDIVIGLVQDNKKKQILITGINTAAEAFLQYKESDILNQPINNIVDPSVINVINDYLEYDSPMHDLYNVFKKMHHFRIRNKLGACVPVTKKLFYVSPGKDMNPRYEMLVRDASIAEKLSEFRFKLYKEYSANYNIHPVLGIPDEASTRKEFTVINQFVRDGNNINAVVALASISGVGDTNQLVLAIKEMGELFKMNTREEDFLGYLDNNVMLIMLMGCPPQFAINALTRLQEVLSKPLQNISGTFGSHPELSIGYGNFTPGQENPELIPRAMDALLTAKKSNSTKIAVF